MVGGNLKLNRSEARKLMYLHGTCGNMRSDEIPATRSLPCTPLGTPIPLTQRYVWDTHSSVQSVAVVLDFDGYSGVYQQSHRKLPHGLNVRFSPFNLRSSIWIGDFTSILSLLPHLPPVGRVFSKHCRNLIVSPLTDPCQPVQQVSDEVSSIGQSTLQKKG